MKPGAVLERSNPEMNPGSPKRAPPASAGDSALVEQARRGDLRAYESLVEAYTDRAFGLALRIVRSTPDAEEVVQDAFVRAWKALPGFRADAAFATWLYRIVTNCALDRWARLKHRARRESPLDGYEEGAAAGLPAQAADAPEHARIVRMIGGLPEMQRAVLTLYYLQDRSVSDVAATLHLNENTVKTHLHRARAALRQAWCAGETS